MYVYVRRYVVILATWNQPGLNPATLTRPQPSESGNPAVAMQPGRIVPSSIRAEH